MIEVLILGGYLAVLIYAFLLDVNIDFREYMTDLSEILIKHTNIKNMHPYSLMNVIGMALAGTSWIGFGVLIFFIVDYLICKYKYCTKIQ